MAWTSFRWCGLAACGLIAAGVAGGAAARDFTAEATATLLSGGVPIDSDQDQVQNTNIFENTDANAQVVAGDASARARMLWAGQIGDFVRAASSLEDEVPLLTSVFLPSEFTGFGLRGGYELEFNVGQAAGTSAEVEARGTFTRAFTFRRETDIDLSASITPLADTALPGFELGLTLTGDDGVVFDMVTDSLTEFEQALTVPAGTYRVDITAAAKVESDGQSAGSQLGLFGFTVTHFPTGVPDHPLLTGFVGAGNLDILLGDWNQTVEPGSISDPSGDGFVGAADLDLLLGVWNAGTPPTGGAAAVPEPGALGLLTLGGLAVLRRRR